MSQRIPQKSRSPAGGPALHAHLPGADPGDQVRRRRPAGAGAEAGLRPGHHPPPVPGHPPGGGARRRAPDRQGAGQDGHPHPVRGRHAGHRREHHGRGGDGPGRQDQQGDRQPDQHRRRRRGGAERQGRPAAQGPETGVLPPPGGRAPGDHRHRPGGGSDRGEHRNSSAPCRPSTSSR